MDEWGITLNVRGRIARAFNQSMSGAEGYVWRHPWVEISGLECSRRTLAARMPHRGGFRIAVFRGRLIEEMVAFCRAHGVEVREVRSTGGWLFNPDPRGSMNPVRGRRRRD